MTSPSTSSISTTKPLTLSCIHTTWTNALSLPPTQRLSSLRRLLRHLSSTSSPKSHLKSDLSSLVSSPATTVLVDPSLTRLHLDLALTYAFLGEYCLASIFFKEAVAASLPLCRYTAFALYGLGLANAELKQWRSAKRQWKRCLECFNKTGDDRIVFQSAARMERNEHVMHPGTEIQGIGGPTSNSPFSGLGPGRVFSLERCRVERNVQIALLVTSSRHFQVSVPYPSQQQNYGINGIPAGMVFGPDWPAGLSISNTRSGSLRAKTEGIPATIPLPAADIKKVTTVPITKADCFPPLADIGKPLPLRPIKTWLQRPLPPSPTPLPPAPTTGRPPANRMLLKPAMVLGEDVSLLASESSTMGLDPPEQSSERYHSQLGDQEATYTPSLYSPTPKISRDKVVVGRNTITPQTSPSISTNLAAGLSDPGMRLATPRSAGRDSVREKIEEAIGMWRNRGWRDEGIRWEVDNEHPERYHRPNPQNDQILEENEEHWTPSSPTLLSSPDDHSTNNIPPKASISPHLPRRKTRIHAHFHPISFTNDEDSTLISSAPSPPLPLKQPTLDATGKIIQPIVFNSQRFSRSSFDQHPIVSRNDNDDDDEGAARLSESYDYYNYTHIENCGLSSSSSSLPQGGLGDVTGDMGGELLQPKRFEGFGNRQSQRK